MKIPVITNPPAGARPELSMGRLKPLLFAAGALLGAALVATLWFALAQPVKVLPRMRTMPAFLLTDQDGRPAGDAELRGRMVLMSFSYTRCGAGCAELRDRLQGLRVGLGQAGVLGKELTFATISLDPAHDTPAALRAFAAQADADPASWTYLTGAPAEIKGLVGGELSIYYGQPDASGSIEHDQEVLLIDEKGVLRSRYQLSDLTMARLTRDLGLLTQERTSSGVMRQVYEVSHLFLCYPD
jgi:protein SCO1/2